MSLADKLIALKDEIGENYLLIDFDLFCRESDNGPCHFVIDEREELEEIFGVVGKIRAADPDARFYVCTYSVDYETDIPFVYSDTLYVWTSADGNAVVQMFRETEQAEPSAIAVISGAAIEEEEVVLVVNADGSTESYTRFRAACKPGSIVGVHWD